MPRSTELTTHFQYARRLARLVAPGYRVFSTDQLRRNECVLDVRRRTIEVGEGTRDFDAVGAVLFQLGHIRLSREKEFADHFGKLTSTDEVDLLERLCKQGTKADKKASKWALEVMLGNFAVTQERAKSIIESYIWEQEMWREYYEKSQD